MRIKTILLRIIYVALTLAIIVNFIYYYINISREKEQQAEPTVGDYITYVEYNVTYKAMEKALQADIDSNNDEDVHLDWVEILAYLAASYWGEWSRYEASDMDALIEKLSQGEPIKKLGEKYELFDYYMEAYSSILGGMVGEYKVGTGENDTDGNPILENKYGLKSYSPIAYGYAFSHFDDFGNSRGYGYKRNHLGNDLFASVGTPIVAVESGIITKIGWNQYGGWRIGIRSLDGKRYYYYAHMRKDHPFIKTLTEGTLVNAGDIIGYVGMTGYSATENVNGMTKPHLHFGLQLIFDESQLEGENQIWIDMNDVIKLLEKHKSPLEKVEGEDDLVRKYEFEDPAAEDYLKRNSSVIPQASD